ncbi:MAG: hypothetical protein Roseis2KO_27580 [Roseivirga sp.]
MFALTSRIKIGDIVLNQVHDIKIEKSWRKLDDKALIKFPRANKLLAKRFKVGDPVTIELAYDGEFKQVEFEGYVKKIMPNIPLMIECEDPIWLLRQGSVNLEWKNTTVRSIVSKIIGIANEANADRASTPITLIGKEGEEDVQLSTFRITNASAAEAINKVKQEFGLAAYFKGHQLYVGLAYGNPGARVGYHVAKNVIKNNLTFRKKEDIKIKVKAISILEDNERLVKELGDDNGDQRTLYFQNITDEKRLTEMARAKLDELKYDGFEGDISTFLIPYAEPGMTGVITDPDQPEQKDGAYVIDSVTTTFGVKGARRKVELGALVGDTE